MPCGSKIVYKSANGWKWFTNIAEDCNGIEEVEDNNAITIYPNPANDKVTIDAKGKISLFNSKGQVIKTLNNADNSVTIDVNGWESGVYYIKIGNVRKKLVVQ